MLCRVAREGDPIFLWVERDERGERDGKGQKGRKGGRVSIDRHGEELQPTTLLIPMTIHAIPWPSTSVSQRC